VEERASVIPPARGYLILRGLLLGWRQSAWLISCGEIHTRANARGSIASFFEWQGPECRIAAEVERLIKAAKHGRYAQRDAALILVAYRHGLRAREIADLNGHRWNGAASHAARP
jgi:site-specific recombinase XerC